MKKIMIWLMAAAMITACENDDTDFSEYINGGQSGVTTISIAYNGTSVSVTGDTKGYVATNGADVTVNATNSTDSLMLVLSGTTTDGSLLIFREKQFGIKLNGVSINNNDGPAINNQCSKALYLDVADGTTNTLTDGTSYNESVSYQQKGTLFSEGQIYFLGTGTLKVTGNSKNAIACDDYIIMDQATVYANTTTGNGIKVNDGIWINGGALNIGVTADGGRGIKCDSTVTISGGTTIITTSGDCVYDSDEQDYSSAACIKCDYDFTMTAGKLVMNSSGDGGKGLNCSTKVAFSGGELTATTIGSNDNGKPKAVKGDGGIIVSGGTFKANVNKSWACDNGSDSEMPEDHLTVTGSPQTATITKKSVEITY